MELLSKQSLVLVAGLWTGQMFANPQPTVVASCKIKHSCGKGGDKISVSFDGAFIDDEMKILSMDAQVSQDLGCEHTAHITAALSKDDECGEDNPYCRSVIKMVINDGDAAVGYANNASKVGVIHDGVKLSCVLEVSEE